MFITHLKLLLFKLQEINPANLLLKSTCHEFLSWLARDPSHHHYGFDFRIELTHKSLSHELLADYLSAKRKTEEG